MPATTWTSYRTLMVSAALAATAATPFTTGAALAQEAPPTVEAARTPPARVNMADFLVNHPHITNWVVWGLPAPAVKSADLAVTGGQALRIPVTAVGNPWSVGAIMPTHAAIKAGDVVLLGVWLRSAGEGPATVRTLRVEQKAAPNGTIVQAGNIAVTNTWTLVYASGVADKTYGPTETSIVVHLGGQVQTLDIGPALLFDLGPDYDRSRLPTNASPIS